MHDVIVIGAGPAGNMAALRLADVGRDVVVLDWRSDVGDKLPSFRVLTNPVGYWLNCCTLPTFKNRLDRAAVCCEPASVVRARDKCRQRSLDPANSAK